jgi:cell division protein ZipA
MNELQITLLILAALFIGGLYWMGQRRKRQQQSVQPQSDNENAQVEPHSSEQSAEHAQQDLFVDNDSLGELREENGKLVLDLGEVDVLDVPDVSDQSARSNFGRPDTNQQEEQIVGEQAAVREPQLFAIMVIGTRAYDLVTIKHALMAVGMVYDEQEQIFVYKDESGQIYLRAANALDPGLIPQQDDPDFATPGIALILQLPTTIHAPRAMEDMIKAARKLSQRLEAHLYDMHRQRITESDLRRMRQAALDYVSVPLK